MFCPNCSSPLPAGAMFCGECGRAVTSADIAAQRAAGSPGPGDTSHGAADVAPPSQLRQPPRPARRDGEPWWVRGRDVVDGTQAPEKPAPAPMTPHAVTPPAWADDPYQRFHRPAPQATPPSSRDDDVAESAPTVVPDTAAAPAPTGQRETAPEPTEARAPVVPPAPPMPPAPAPLRTPDRHGDNGPRPTSVPLWTASLTPVTDAIDSASPSDAVPAPVPAATHEPELAAATESTPSAESERPSVPTPESGPEARAGSVVASAGPEAPQEGDTATILPVDTLTARPRSGSSPASDRADAAPSLSPDETAQPAAEAASAGEADAPPAEREPVPLVEPGSARVVERCTTCGAEIGEDDIFCGECGAVVQSVALSFTGPVVPLPPEWRPETATGVAPAGAAPGDVVRTDGAPAGAAPAAPASRDVEQAPVDQTPTEQAAVDRTGGQHAAIQQDGADRAGVDRAPVAPTSDERAAVDPTPDERAPHQPAPDERAGRRPLVPPTTADRGELPGPISHVPGATGAALRDDVRPPAPSVSPAPPSAVPSWAARSVAPADDDDVDETRIVRRAPAGVSYGLQFSTGESVTVDGSGLIGRAPTAQPGERFDLLVRIVDPGKSVSKTHLEFGQEDGSLWVSDRWSGNGTVVRDQRHGVRRLEPGTRVHVGRGSRVEIGEQFIIVT